MGSFLEQFLEPALEVDMGWDAEAYRTQHGEALMEISGWAHFAQDVPRRLGADATPKELGWDKRLSRKLESRHYSIARLWNFHPADVTEFIMNHQDNLRVSGAQVDWEAWWEERMAHLRKQLRVVATTGLKTGDNISIANSYCNRIINELAQIQQVFDNNPRPS